MAQRLNKRQRLQLLVDMVGQAMDLPLEVRGDPDEMLVVEVDDTGAVVSHPFGRVGRPANEVKTAMRFVALALRKTGVAA